MTNGDGFSKAMESPMLGRGEIIQIKSHQNVDQLVSILLAISENRMLSYKNGVKKATAVGFWFVMLYSVLSAIIALWVTWIQYGASNASMGLSASGF